MMRDEVRRILKLVQEGKLSSEDAAELIEAFEEPGPASEEEKGEESPEASADSEAERTPWAQLVEAIERLGREVATGVDWKHVAEQARSSARKGVDAIRVGVERIRAQDFDLPWNSNAEVKEVDLPLSLPQGKTLKIVNPCGRIKVEGGHPVGSVKAKAKIRAASQDDARQRAELYTLTLEESDRAVLIRQPDLSGLEVELTILLDTGDVEIVSESGDVDVRGCQGTCRVTAKSGDTRIDGARKFVEVRLQSGNVDVSDSTLESLEIESKSGDINLAKIVGSVSIRTASGDIRLKGVESSSLNVECVSGDIEAELGGPCAGTMSCRTVSGDISVAIPADADCRVSLSTLRGESKCYLALADEAKADQRVTGQLGNGTGKLDASSVTGNVGLKARV